MALTFRSCYGGGGCLVLSGLLFFWRTKIFCPALLFISKVMTLISNYFDLGAKSDANQIQTSLAEEQQWGWSPDVTWWLQLVELGVCIVLPSFPQTSLWFLNLITSQNERSLSSSVLSMSFPARGHQFSHSNRYLSHSWGWVGYIIKQIMLRILYPILV